MSRESVRDLRQGGAVGPPRVRGPVRDRLSAEPEPDQGGAGEPDGRPLRWRVAATIVLVLILGIVGVLLVIDSQPVDCGQLTAQSEWTSDVAADLTDTGCPVVDLTARP